MIFIKTGSFIPGIALTQSLDVESPLLLIFDEVGDVETGRNRVAGWKGIAGTVDSNARHDIEGRSE